MAHGRCEFFEFAADWADLKHVDYSFYRDEYDIWNCRLTFSDTIGPLSVEVEAMGRPKGYSAERFRDRVYDMMAEAARKARLRMLHRGAKRVAAGRA